MGCKGSLTLAAALCCVSLFSIARRQTASPSPHAAGELRRQAILGVDLSTPSPPKPGAEVRRIKHPATADRMGLRAGDRNLSVNGKPLDGFVSFQRIIP